MNFPHFIASDRAIVRVADLIAYRNRTHPEPTMPRRIAEGLVIDAVPVVPAYVIGAMRSTGGNPQMGA